MFHCWCTIETSQVGWFTQTSEYRQGRWTQGGQERRRGQQQHGRRKPARELTNGEYEHTSRFTVRILSAVVLLFLLLLFFYLIILFALFFLRLKTKNKNNVRFSSFFFFCWYLLVILSLQCVHRAPFLLLLVFLFVIRVSSFLPSALACLCLFIYALYMLYFCFSFDMVKRKRVEHWLVCVCVSSAPRESDEAFVAPNRKVHVASSGDFWICVCLRWFSRAGDDTKRLSLSLFPVSFTVRVLTLFFLFPLLWLFLAHMHFFFFFWFYDYHRHHKQTGAKNANH